MDEDWKSAAEWAALRLPEIPSTERRVGAKAQRENWRSRDRTGRGGGREYHVSSLPAAARVEFARRSACAVPAASAPVPALAPLAPALPASEEARLRQDYKLAILSAFDRFHAASGDALTPARHKFVGFYNARQIDIPDWARAASPTISMSSLERWTKARASGDAAALAGRYGNRKGTGVLDSAVMDIRGFMVAVLVENPHLSMHQVRKLLVQRFGEDVELFDGTSRPLPSERRLMDLWQSWKDKNRQLHLALTNPDDWKNRHRVAVGSYSEGIERPNQLWEIDASPSDVLLTDGRHSIYVVIDVHTRRIMVLVTKVPRTSAVLLLIRRAILAWGMPEAIKTDNGSDFVSREAERAYFLLGVQHPTCTPYSPEQKPHVERAIGTVQHAFMPLLPGYTGHNVATRQAMTDEIAWIAELDYRRPSGAAETLHLSRGAVRPMPASCPDRPNQKYSNRMTEVPSYQTRVMADPSRLGGAIGAGNLTASNADGALSYLRDCRPTDVRVWRGVSGRPLAEWRPVAAVRAGALRWDIGGDQPGRLSIPLLDARADLEDPIQDVTYAGTNSGATGYEGEPGGIKGQAKPIALGDLTDAHVPGVWVNQPAAVAQLHDGAGAGALAAVAAIWDRGGPAGLTLLSNSTGGTFDGATPSAVQYATDLARGYVKIGGTLGAQPTFGLRGPASAGDTVPAVLRWLLTRRGHAGRIGASLAGWASAAKVGVWLGQPASYREAWDAVAASAAVWVLPDASGLWQVGTLSAPVGAPVLALSERKIKEIAVAETRSKLDRTPGGGRIVAYQRPMRVQTLAFEDLTEDEAARFQDLSARLDLVGPVAVIPEPKKTRHLWREAFVGFLAGAVTRRQVAPDLWRATLKIEEMVG